MKVAKINSLRAHSADEGPRDGLSLAFGNSLRTDFWVWDPLMPHLTAPAGDYYMGDLWPTRRH